MGEPEQSGGGGNRMQFRVCNLEELQFPDSSINILHDTEFLENCLHLGCHFSLSRQRGSLFTLISFIQVFFNKLCSHA